MLWQKSQNRLKISLELLKKSICSYFIFSLSITILIIGLLHFPYFIESVLIIYIFSGEISIPSRFPDIIERLYTLSSYHFNIFLFMYM